MLTFDDWQRVAHLNGSYGDSGGACFGVTDPSRLRPAFPKPMPPLKEGAPARKIVMVERDGNMVPEDDPEK